jgi:hypothetical protein
MTPLLGRLKGVRQAIPYEYWLVYDAVIGGLLIAGLLVYSPVFIVGVPFLLAAVVFDLVEYIVKVQEDLG